MKRLLRELENGESDRLSFESVCYFRTDSGRERFAQLKNGLEMLILADEELMNPEMASARGKSAEEKRLGILLNAIKGRRIAARMLRKAGVAVTLPSLRRLETHVSRKRLKWVGGRLVRTLLGLIH